MTREVAAPSLNIYMSKPPSSHSRGSYEDPNTQVHTCFQLQDLARVPSLGNHEGTFPSRRDYGGKLVNV